MLAFKVPDSKQAVIDQIRTIWDHAHSRFDKIQQLIENNKPIKQKYFSQLSGNGTKPNKIHRMFHPALMEQMIKIYTGKKLSNDARAAFNDCLLKYLGRWAVILRSMEAYYEDPNVLQPVISAYELMLYTTGFLIPNTKELEALCPNDLTLRQAFDKNEYAVRYEDFCAKLDALPRSRDTVLRLLKQINSHTKICAPAFPAIVPSDYMKRIVADCDRARQIISIRGVGSFHIPSRSNVMWDVISQLVTQGDERNDGYVSIVSHTKSGNENWRSSFSCGKPANTPEGLFASKDLLNYIHTEPHTRNKRYRLLNIHK